MSTNGKNSLNLKAMSALGLLLLVGAQGTTIISIKYPPDQQATPQQQPAKRDLSLSYAATNIDSKEGTRVKTITVIKNVGGVHDVGGSSAAATSNRQVKLAINPELHKNEEWANAFRDNFESYGGLPDVPDIDDLFDFVNRKKPAKETKEKKEKPTESTTTKSSSSPPSPATTKKATSEHAEDADDDNDSDAAIVKKIKGDAELLPHIQQANILRLQAQELRQQKQQQQQQPELEQTKRSLVNVNYSTPMHSVSQFFENYVQVLPNGYDYTKPQPEPPQQQQPCAVPVPPNNSIQVTTPSGRSYDIPQSNSSGQNGGINHPYVAPALAKRTQIQPAPQPQQQPSPPSYATVNSIVPPIVQSNNNNNNNLPSQQQPQSPGVSTSQRPYLAPSLRNNGLGINRGPSTPQPLPGNNNNNNIDNNGNALPSYRLNGFGGNRPHNFRSRGLKY
ncbi:hypothetical protein KR044_007883 [Drosophila immigrans]|nr:hypothetical protein KR044_007883 [Drosophila immigrans]